MYLYEDVNSRFFPTQPAPVWRITIKFDAFLKLERHKNLSERNSVNHRLSILNVRIVLSLQL